MKFSSDMKKYSNYFRLLILSYCLLLPVFAHASTNTTQIGRYITVENKPKPYQVDLLSQTIQVRFPQTVQTIGDAMNYLLRFSGYSLVSNERMNAAFRMTLTKPLPTVDRDFGPMSLQEALTTLAGPAFYLVKDPLNREVNFPIKPYYARIFMHTKTHQHSK